VCVKYFLSSLEVFLLEIYKIIDKFCIKPLFDRNRRIWVHVASLIKIREFNNAYSIRVFLEID
jgi:hypothetical protein